MKLGSLCKCMSEIPIFAANIDLLMNAPVSLQVLGLKNQLSCETFWTLSLDGDSIKFDSRIYTIVPS